MHINVFPGVISLQNIELSELLMLTRFSGSSISIRDCSYVSWPSDYLIYDFSHSILLSESVPALIGESHKSKFTLLDGFWEVRW